MSTYRPMAVTRSCTKSRSVRVCPCAGAGRRDAAGGVVHRLLDVERRVADGIEHESLHLDGIQWMRIYDDKRRRMIKVVTSEVTAPIAATSSPTTSRSVQMSVTR